MYADVRFNRCITAVPRPRSSSSIGILDGSIEHRSNACVLHKFTPSHSPMALLRRAFGMRGCAKPVTPRQTRPSTSSLIVERVGVLWGKEESLASRVAAVTGRASRTPRVCCAFCCWPAAAAAGGRQPPVYCGCGVWFASGLRGKRDEQRVIMTSELQRAGRAADRDLHGGASELDRSMRGSLCQCMCGWEMR